MRNNGYYRQPVHRICRAVWRLLEIMAIVAIPAFAFVWSGKYTQKIHLLSAAVDSLKYLSDCRNISGLDNNIISDALSDDDAYIAADSTYIRPEIKTDVEITGIVNTGKNRGLQEFINNQGQYELDREDLYIILLEGGYASEEYIGKLLDMADKDYRVREILQSPCDFPKELIETVAKYPETVQFVYDYPEKKDRAPADDVGLIVDDEIPLLLQWDERWGYSRYGDFWIANSGCGPTCLSMVAVGLTKNTNITPKVVADYAQENGFYQSGAGSKWTLMTEGAKHFGLKGTELTLDKAVVFENLDKGRPIICSMGPGDFTYYGHFIVLTKNINGKIQVNDPNSCGNSGKLWTYEELEWQICNLWSFEIQ